MGASREQIKAVLKQARHPQPLAGTRKIFERVHQPHLQANAVITRTKARLMLVGSRQLLPLIEQIAQYDKEIAPLFLTHEDHTIFASLPRAGKRLASRRLPEIGDDRTRYQSASSLQALGGTSPVLYQSGMYSKAHRRLGGIKPLRNALHQFAWQTTQCEAWAKE
ncbi:MAG: transposase [Ktedonobacteraceae bacterium]